MLNIAVINSSRKSGNTHVYVDILLEKLKEKAEVNVTEYFLGKDFNKFCIGCNQCILSDEGKCPNYDSISPIIESLLKSDVVILSSPVYVFDVSGSMKSFLDHTAYMWMMHRPRESMFKKYAVGISSAAGGGIGHTNKTFKNNFLFWGVGKYKTLGFRVFGKSKEDIIIDKKINRDIDKLSRDILNWNKKQSKKPSILTRGIFMIASKMQKSNTWTEVDYNYWKDKGWVDNKKPW